LGALGPFGLTGRADYVGLVAPKIAARPLRYGPRW
jgi:hypothetical protein